MQERSDLNEDQAEAEAKKLLVQSGLINRDMINLDDDEDVAIQKMMRVDDYTEEEIHDDIELVDWEFAYNEILKLEERKKVKYTMEADKKA